MTSYLHLSYDTPTRVWKSARDGGREVTSRKVECI